MSEKLKLPGLDIPQNNIIGVLDDEDEDICTNIEADFGTNEYYKRRYNKIFSKLLTNFLIDEIELIIEKSHDNKEEMKEYLITLSNVYFEVRTEFEKHENKLKKY